MIQELLKLLFKGLNALLDFLFSKKKPKSGFHEIGTHKSLQKKYGLYAENRPLIKLNPVNIPEGLRDLIPYAEKWGISDDIIRYDFVTKADSAEKTNFKQVVTNRAQEINKWLDTFPQGENMSEEAAAYMYMLLCTEEMD